MKGIIRKVIISIEKFTLIMPSEDSKYLSDYYTIVDLKVTSYKKIYMLSIAGEDEEWPTDFGVYTLID